jgi:glycosyltransferase involved in cell wall biosynthesis
VRILAFTFEAPTYMYGGGIGIIQSLTSLSSFSELTYVGPKFDESEFPNIRLAHRYFLSETTFVPAKALNMFRGVAIRYFQAWKEAVATLDPNAYDLVFIDFSYNNYIVDWAHEHGLKTIVRVHNIERDMAYNSAHGSVHDKYWFKTRLTGNIISRHEELCVRDCDALIFLTATDRDRALELYGQDIAGKSTVVPVCVAEQGAVSNISASPEIPDYGLYALTTGSLNYGPNIVGVEWLVRDVWPKVLEANLQPSLNLVIAGRHPSRDLQQLIGETNNCYLVDTPPTMVPYFQGASICAAPIFSGAGMKVKVAEALSYGLHVVGSHHALIGYEEASSVCYETEDAAEFANELIRLASVPHLDKTEVKNQFEKLYTLQRSSSDFRKVAQSLIES